MGFTYSVFVVALKDLMICITEQAEVMIDETLTQGYRHGNEFETTALILKNAPQPFQLSGIFGKNVGSVPFLAALAEILMQQSELPDKNRLRGKIPVQRFSPFDSGMVLQAVPRPFHQGAAEQIF